jgi:hypothetical protein
MRAKRQFWVYCTFRWVEVLYYSAFYPERDVTRYRWSEFD